MSTHPTFAPDGAMVLGMAATAMPFARTPEDQAERWLRALRLHGEVGAALEGLGVSEVPLPGPGASAERTQGVSGQHEQRDRVALVTENSMRIAAERGATVVATTDVLLAVIHVYGSEFEAVLRAHGTDTDELIECLGAGVTESVDG